MLLDAGCDRSPTWRTHSSHLDDGGGLPTIRITARISGLGESGPSGLLTTTLLLAYYSLFRVTVTDYTQHEDCRITAPRCYAEGVNDREFQQYICMVQTLCSDLFNSWFMHAIEASRLTV